MNKITKNVVTITVAAALATTALILPQAETVKADISTSDYLEESSEDSFIWEESDELVGRDDNWEYHKVTVANGGFITYYAVAIEDGEYTDDENAYAVDESGVVYDADGNPVLWEGYSLEDVDWNAPWLEDEIWVYQGETYKLKMRKADGTVITGKDIAWTSTDTSVAKVNKNGKITAKNGGTCKVKAVMDGVTYKCKVHVIGLNTRKLTLKVGETYKLKLKGTSWERIWSDNEAVAKFKGMGTTVKALKPGKATMAMEDRDGNVYKCKVTVTE